MQRALDGFNASLANVRHLEGIRSTIAGMTTGAVDLSDILRAQIVLVVSAMDYLVHELTLVGMMDIFDGKRPSTAHYTAYKLSASLLSLPLPAQRAALEAEIRERHSFQSFQQPTKIADAIRIFHPKPLWSDVAASLAMAEIDVKTKLSLIVERRNKIAHEADLDPSFYGSASPMSRWPISPNDATAATDFVEKVGLAIHAVVK